MSEAVVVVGPTLVSGPGVVDREMAALAMESIDDDLALVDDRVVSVDDLWRDVLGSAVHGSCARLSLICPSWWPRSRVERIRASAGEWSANVVVLSRADVLATAATVLELSPELVVVHADAQRHVITRVNAGSGVLDAVVACVEGLAAVTIDVPPSVTPFGTELVRALRRRGVDVTVADDQTLVGAVRRQHGEAGCDAPSIGRRLTPRAAAVAVAILSAGALTAAALGLDAGAEELPDGAWLVEGRVAVEVPSQWTVERITAGSGSARVQVVSPVNTLDAIHVTQSWVPDAQTLEAAAEALRNALAEQPDGVFVDFSAVGERAQRAAVTYREIRTDRRVDWTVLLDGDVRIAIGCQGAADHPGPVVLCDRAIRSAHAVGRK